MLMKKAFFSANISIANSIYKFIPFLYSTYKIYLPKSISQKQFIHIFQFFFVFITISKMIFSMSVELVMFFSVIVVS